MKHDTTRLTELGRKHQETRQAYEDARDALMPEVEAAIRAGVRQVDIVKATGLTRERIRQIEKGLES